MTNSALARRRWIIALSGVICNSMCRVSDAEPLRFGFLWHMHQPVYYPYESITQTQANGRYTFNVIDIHNQRFGPYSTWPRDAVQAGAGLPHLGASVSFSGSLIENLNALAAAGVNGGMWTNWFNGYRQGIALATTLGNPRLDLVAFGYHHPLLSLLDVQDMRMQIKLHKHVYGQAWAGGPAYSAGMFPPETAFSTRIIPALVAEGVEWVLVDNIHFDRACAGYPHTNASCIYAPNAADQINPDPATTGGAWVQLNNLWAPSQVSAPFGYQPHLAEYVDPSTGEIAQIIAVPAARYEGNEDGRGGYGAFLYDQVMDAYLAYNNDPAHPMFVVLHHDGDNYGGGTDAYYHSNFQNMISWVTSDPDYEATTVQDYLDRFPVAAGDVIHIENGAWAGADCGDPEFKKWLGDPNGSGWSPDRNSWAVLTAAKNRVFMAEAIAPAVSMQNVMTGGGTNTEKAWHYLLCSEASDYWYWDSSGEPWDSNVTRGCNQAVSFADSVIAGQTDTTPPTVFVPQREPYNPGGIEWGPSVEPSDFEVWTYADDVSGLTSVTLKWRVDGDGLNPIASIQNETYAGGPEVGVWNSAAMSVTPPPTVPANILAATYRASRYAAMITGQQDVLIDYYVETLDGAGNLARTDIQHVYVGTTATGGGDVVEVAPDPPLAGQNVTVRYDPAGRPLAGAGTVKMHYGFNTWNPVISPDPTMTWNAGISRWEMTVAVLGSATQLDVVFNNGAGTWDNNGGQDWHFAVQGGAPELGWTMDGQRDADASLVAQNGAMSLYAGVRGTKLYVAAPDAGEGNDHFILVAAVPGALRAAPWAKAGQVADWSAFLADENNNDYEGWFDQGAGVPVQAMTGANGGYLEGTIDLAAELGAMPDQVYLAFLPYTNNDGGTLVSGSQVPASINANGTVEAGEYVLFQTYLRGDLNADWSVDLLDVSGFVEVLLGNDIDTAHFRAADMDGGGEANGADIAAFAATIMAP
ncbi:MAG TPA: carbohydrate binding domain-containing protein [Phycisphaerae bacterium]|nr:carbohydrate binding domain-containing protein [Phycisphaerae bacterium]